MDILTKAYDKIKYDKKSKVKSSAYFYNVKSIKIANIEDNEIINQGFDELDDYKEYLIIENSNGEKSTFRNSYVDIFKA